MVIAKIKQFTTAARNNKKVVENYFFMTALQVLNSLFYLLIYPYLIRTLGAESYGLYIFAMSIVYYFTTFVNFGFELPALKAISLNQDDNKIKSDVLSSIFTCKIYLELIASIIFVAIVFLIPFLRDNWLIYIVCFTTTLSAILLPQWYFQGVQKMKVVTYIQLGFKLLTLPFIIIYVNSPSDLYIFAIISSAGTVIGGIVATLMIIVKDKLRYRIKPFSKLKNWIKDGLPFFATTAIGTLKLKSIEIIIGSFFGMREVAIYDLANKIFTVPNLLASSVNSALFPKIINNLHKGIVKRIWRFETILSVAAIAFVIIFGKPAIILLGGEDMLAAYPAACILSLWIPAFLIVGSFINFIFIPNNRYELVLYNQIIATVAYFISTALLIYFWQSTLSLVTAIAISAIVEIIFCAVIIMKNPNLLLFNDIKKTAC